MKICEKLKSIFKSSSDGKKVFGDITNRELVSLSVDELKNKVEKEKKKLIKKIPSLNKEQRENEFAEISKGMKFFKELKLERKLAGNLTIKYTFLYDCFKEYQDELRKIMDDS